MPSINTIDGILSNQIAAETRFSRAKQALKQTTLRNALAIGKQITSLRKGAGVSRKHVCNVIKVSPSTMYFMENPNKAAVLPTPKNQVRYYNVVKQICSGVNKVSESVQFERSGRGRPRLVAVA